MSPLRSLLLACTGLVLVLLGACSGAPSPSDPQPSGPRPTDSGPTGTADAATPVPAPTPRRGACYRLTYDQALAPTSASAPVPCRAEYTARTFHVGRISAELEGHLLAVDSQRVQDAIATTCPRRLPAWLGTDQTGVRLSVFRPVWFSPTLAESDAGADWFRCDVVALDRDRQLVALSGRLKGALASPQGRRRYGLCATARPGTTGSERTMCARADQWRAIEVVTFEGRRFPGRDQVRQAGRGPCEEAARGAASDPLNFDWAYEWPSRKQWRNGVRYGLCWAPTDQ